MFKQHGGSSMEIRLRYKIVPFPLIKFFLSTTLDIVHRDVTWLLTRGVPNRGVSSVDEFGESLEIIIMVRKEKMPFYGVWTAAPKAGLI